MNLMCIVYCVLGMLAIAESIEINSAQQQHSTIVEKNHFYSNYEINTTYDIAKVNNEKPIILYLKKKDENSVFDNNIQINLISGEKQSQCFFTSFDKMCFLNNLPTSNMKLKIKCEHLPCEVSWTILQPAMKKVKQNQQISDLFDISESNQHMIAMVTCNNPQIKDFNQKVEAFSENDYTRGYTSNIIYFLFSKQKEGHLYFKIQEQAKSCAQMAVYNVNQNIPEDKQLKDFILPNNKSTFKFQSRPTKQIRFDASIHQLNKQPITSQLEIKIMGDKNGGSQQIVSQSIRPGFATTVYDFSFVTPAIKQEYSNIRIQFKSDNKILMLNFQMHQGVADIQQTQHSHFSMHAGDLLNYRIVPNQKANEDQKVKIFVANTDKVKQNKQQCLKKQGCQFQVTAITDVKSLLYVGESAKSESTKKEISFIQFSDKVTHKIRQDDVIYLKKNIKKDKYFQVVVNNPNVILYAANQLKCETPSQQCYENIANIHNPFIYAPKKDGILLIAVEGLQNCEFTVTTIVSGDGAIQLSDEQPFAYLMDDHQSSLVFKFTSTGKEDVRFNLIAPFNQLLLIVKQGREDPDPDEDKTSLDGFISIPKTEIKQKQFRIMVKKTESSKSKFVHFTLIASTGSENLRLDPGVAHYQTITSRQHRDLVFQFDKSQDYLVNFYLYNIVNQQDIKVSLLVFNKDEWTDEKVQNFQIESQSDVLNLKDVSQYLCREQGEINCEIFIRLINLMDIEVDLTITLLVKDSVIELKDGIWQSFALNQVAQTSHFFFLPKNKKKSISIIYRSTQVDFGVVYSMWKSDQKTISPTQWPFPSAKSGNNNKMDQFKGINHIVIDVQNIQQCWPSCIVLVSLYKKSHAQVKNPAVAGNFNIMASNELLQLPQRTKLDVYLKKEEEKFIMVDLKYALDKEALTFFRTSIIGYQFLSANVYSQKNQRCPEDYDYDFSFGDVETIIKIDSIKQKMAQNDMEDDENIYLCILAKAYIQSKFNIEYTSDDQVNKVLKYDTFQTVTLEEKTPKIFQLEAWQYYEIKFTREKGYFYVKLAVCDNEKDGGYEQCLDDLKGDSDRGKKILSKTEQFSQEPCAKCIVYIRLQSDEPSQLIVHVQSKYSTIELREKDIISDFTNEGEQNKYTLTSIQSQETIINIEVGQGEPVVTITDYGQLEIVKEKDPNTNNIHIVIPPMQQSTGLATYGGSNYYAFGYSNTFRFLAIKIKSKNPKLPCSYSISYSSGDSQTYLQSGLLAGYTLDANKLSKFLYRNPNPTELNHGYITISMNKSSTLYNVKLKMYTFDDPNDEETKTQVTPVKPPMRKKTPNPTMTFTLPIAKLVSIELQSAEDAKVTIVVNDQQVIMLPFNQEFPFQLMKSEKINLLADVSNPGYILISLKKCDQSEPTFGYTFNYQNFEKSEFEYSVPLQNDPKFQFLIRASKPGTLYMELNNNQISNGLFAIKTSYSDKKISSGKMKTGNNGIVEYSVMDSKKALIKFNGAVCASGKCLQPIKYYWVAGQNLVDVYAQTVCPYSYFLLADVSSILPLKFNPITVSSANGQITFEYPLLNNISYLSIKAVSGEQQAFYRPIQIATLWGSINKSTWLHKFAVGLVLISLLVCLLVLYRRYINHPKRQNYDQLPENSYDYS